MTLRTLRGPICAIFALLFFVACDSESASTDTGSDASTDAIGDADADDDVAVDSDADSGDAEEVDDFFPPPAVYTLTDDVQIIRDEWGAPHVYAENWRDLMFAQGYATAADRAFNLDQLRRFIYGEQSEAFGEEFLADDFLKRSLRFREICVDNARMYRDDFPEVFADVEVFAAGINSWFDDAKAEANGAVRPMEFDRIGPGYWPEPWTAADTFCIGKGLIFAQTFQADIELAVFAGSEIMGADTLSDVLPFTPLFGTYILEESPTPDDVLSLGQVTRSAGRTFDAPQTTLGALNSADRAKAVVALRAMIDLLASSTGRDTWGTLGGSNSWAVDSDHTEGGAAILCNDTHMGPVLPTRLYPMHITDRSAGDGGLIGYAAPGAPYVIIGNNQDTAWGLTNSYVDTNDLYFEELSGSGTSVRFNGEFVPMGRREITIPVRPEDGTIFDAEPVTRTIRWVPHHGPILNDLLPVELGTILSALGFNFSVRFTGFDDDTREFVTIRNLSRATDIDEQIASLETFDGGVMNWIFADSGGRVAFVSGGPHIERVDDPANPPYRPLPGGGTHEWVRQLSFDEVPRLVDPAKGYVVTANAAIGPNTHNNRPEDGGFYFGSLFDIGTRANRLTKLIQEQIDTGDGLSIEESWSMQVDTKSVLAELLLPSFLTVADRVCTDDGVECEAIAELQDWDMFQPGDSAASTIFNVWMIHFWFETYRDNVPEIIFPLLGAELDNVAGRATTHWVQGRLPPSGTNYFDDVTTEGEESMEDMMVRAFHIAIAEIVGHFGQETAVSDWRWDSAHQVVHNHPVWDDLNVGPMPNDSGIRTINAADWALYPNDELATLPYLQNEGSQIRYCVELGENGPLLRGGLNGGISAHSESEYYDNQIDSWLNNENYALHYLESEVEAAELSRLTLEAGRSGPRP